MLCSPGATRFERQEWYVLLSKTIGRAREVRSRSSSFLTSAKVPIAFRFRAIIAKGFLLLCLTFLNLAKGLSLVVDDAMWKPPYPLMARIFPSDNSRPASRIGSLCRTVSRFAVVRHTLGPQSGQAVVWA